MAETLTPYTIKFLRESTLLIVSLIIDSFIQNCSIQSGESIFSLQTTMSTTFSKEVCLNKRKVECGLIRFSKQKYKKEDSIQRSLLSIINYLPKLFPI